MQSPFVQAAGLLRIIGLFLSGICHQLPGHSLFLADTQMPLCARCTGTYLGALLTIVVFWLRGRSRASRLPPRSVLAVLVFFLISWAIDGLNSYWHFLSGNALLYMPNNGFRLATGLGQGLALAAVVFPLFNATMWQESDAKRSIEDLAELRATALPLLMLAALLVAGPAMLLYPLLLADALSVLLLLGMVNTLIVVLLLRRENRAQSWRQAALPLGLGLLLAMVEVGGIALARAVLWNVVR